VRFVQLACLEPKTIDCYTRWARQLSEHYPGLSVPDLTAGQVQDFLIHRQDIRKLAGSTINQAKQALKGLFRDHLGRRWDIWGKIKPKRDKPLPYILSPNDIRILLDTFEDGRYRALFTLVYHCGLRLFEALAISPKDIDGDRLTLRVRKGKGGKSREVPISQEVLQRLRTFWSWHRNPRWLFPSAGRGWKRATLRQSLRRSKRAMTSSSARAGFQVTLAGSGLLKRHHRIIIHTLRHSYATHMLDEGVSLAQISDYLGHASLRPTLVYLHLTERSETRARTALAALPLPAPR
jgi:integrase